ncbi:MAG: hypothetical protein JXA21_11585 [Anaerolineae bacterium]|nr:hypothetical protein [Anaerolineae bacterium]
MTRRAVLLACVALLLVTGAVWAGGGGGGIGIRRHVLAGGGGHGVTGNFALWGTVGQPVAGPAGAIYPNGSLCSGFWCGKTHWHTAVIYLPLILKG